jgi:ankyrin repeat protein
MPGFDFDLFSNSPLKDLAYAVKQQDTLEIERIAKNGNINVDYQEKKFGHTLLMLAVANNLKISTKKLLELGASPNLIDQYNGESALMISCTSELLVKYGGDVNAVQQLKRKGFYINQTVLMIAVSDPQFEPCNSRFRYLVENGADINAITLDSTSCAVNFALMVNNLEAVRYLLIEKGAEIPKYALIRFQGLPDEENVTIIQLLGEQDYSDDPYRDKIKKELIAYLKSKGY